MKEKNNYRLNFKMSGVQEGREGVRKMTVKQHNHMRSKRRRSTDCCGAVIHPERLLHVGAQQDFSVTDGATVQVHQEADSSALIEVPIKLVWSDLRSICNDIKQ